MTNFRDYRFNQSQVSAVVVDESGGQFLWIAYSLNNGVCLLQKVSANDLTQVYFSVSLSVSAIKGMVILGSYLFVAVSHSTIAAYVLSLSNPLSGQTTFSKASTSLNESPLAVASGASTVYFLTPGVSSAEPAQLMRIDNNGNYLSTISLFISGIFVRNAVSLTVDANENIWIVDSNDPANLFRVFYSGSWQLQKTILN